MNEDLMVTPTCKNLECLPCNFTSFKDTRVSTSPLEAKVSDVWACHVHIFTGPGFRDVPMFSLDIETVILIYALKLKSLMRLD